MDLCAKLCHDCGTACEQHASNLAKGDHSKTDTCVADCEACATECEKSASHMDVCRRCAESCRKCATSCNKAETVQA